MRGRLVVLDLTNAPQSLIGELQRLMLEIRPGTFVGRLIPRTITEVWEMIEKHGATAIFVVQSPNEAGFKVGTTGHDRRIPVDNYGIQLIQYTRNPRKNGGGDKRSRKSTQKQ